MIENTEDKKNEKKIVIKETRFKKKVIVKAIIPVAVKVVPVAPVEFKTYKLNGKTFYCKR